MKRLPLNEIGINIMKITKGEEEKLEIRKQLEEMKTVVRQVRNEMVRTKNKYKCFLRVLFLS